MIRVEAQLSKANKSQTTIQIVQSMLGKVSSSTHKKNGIDFYITIILK